MNAKLSLYSPLLPSFSNRPTLLAALFWFATYVIFSLRSELLIEGTSGLVNGHRALATFVGASAFWLVLTNFTRLTERSSRSPFLVVGAIVPASLSVFAAMVAADSLWPAEALPYTRYVRWVLVWAGYFTAAVSLYVGHRIYRGITVPAAAACERPASSSAARAAPVERREAAGSADAWEWLVDAMAEELAAVPPIERRALAERLVARAGYRLADDSLAPGHNARIELVERLLSRLNRLP